MTRIRELRKSRGMTLKDMAAVFHVSLATVGFWEQGKNEPSYATLKKMSEYFGVSVDYILGNEENIPSGNWIPVYGKVAAGDYVIEQLGKGKPDQFVVDHSAWMISDAWGDFMRTLTDEEYFSFHKLRHYFASNALLLGVPKKYVAVMMGHKGDQMLDKIYAHTFKTPQASFEEQIAASSDNFFR